MQSRCHSEQDLPVGGFIIALHMAFVGHQGTTEVVAEVLKAPMWQFLIQQPLPDIAYYSHAMMALSHLNDKRWVA